VLTRKTLLFICLFGQSYHLPVCKVRQTDVWFLLSTAFMTCNAFIFTERVIYPRKARVMMQRYPVTGGTPITEEVAVVCIQRTQIVTDAIEKKASG